MLQHFKSVWPFYDIADKGLNNNVQVQAFD